MISVAFHHIVKHLTALKQLWILSYRIQCSLLSVFLFVCSFFVKCLMPETVKLQIEEVSEAALVERIRLRKVMAAVDMYDQLVQAGRRISQNGISHIISSFSYDTLQCRLNKKGLPKESQSIWMLNFPQALPCHWIWPTTCWIWFVYTEIRIHHEKIPQNRKRIMW